VNRETGIDTGKKTGRESGIESGMESGIESGMDLCLALLEYTIQPHCNTLTCALLY